MVKYPEESGLLIKGKKQTGGFLGMLLATLGANVLENLLAGKGVDAGDVVI